MYRVLVDGSKKDSLALLQEELNGDLSIPRLIKYLREKSSISHPGNAGTHTRINKEALRLASVYLEDYLNSLEGDI